MNKIDKLFWWIAGANTSILEKCPTDQSKYFGLGGTIFFTAMMASFAGGYAFFTAFHDVFLAVLFGIFWGALIFNLDRYIVSSTGKGDGTIKITKEEWSNATPRIILAILIGSVIAVPLELKVFEREIIVEMDKMINEKRKEIKAGLSDIRNEIQTKKHKKVELENELKKLEEALKGGDVIIDKATTEINYTENELKTKEGQLKEAREKYNAGRDRYNRYNKRLQEIRNDSTMIVAASVIKEYEKKRWLGKSAMNKYGPILNELNKEINNRKAKVDELSTEKEGREGTLKEDYIAMQDKIKIEKNKIDAEIADLEEQLTRKEKEADDTSIQFNGFMARLIALDRLSVDADTIYTYVYPSAVNAGLETDSTETATSTLATPIKEVAEINEDWTPVFYAKWMITLLLICIEITPILFKMMTESGPYDDRIEEIRYASEVSKKKFISDLNESINNELKLSNTLNRNKIDTELKANQALMDSIAAAQAAIAAVAIKEWQDKKVQEVQANPTLVVKEKVA